MPLNTEKSREQDKEQCKELLVNTDPGHHLPPNVEFPTRFC